MHLTLRRGGEGGEKKERRGRGRGSEKHAVDKTGCGRAVTPAVGGRAGGRGAGGQRQDNVSLSPALKQAT